MLKMFAVTLAAPNADILNFSFSECRCLRAWKLGDIPDISVTVFDKDLRQVTVHPHYPISLKPLSSTNP